MIGSAYPHVSIVHPQAVVLVIGSNDTGKTTYCRNLVEQGVSQGLKVGLVDADVGQSQVGPPTTSWTQRSCPRALNGRILKPTIFTLLVGSLPKAISCGA